VAKVNEEFDMAIALEIITDDGQEINLDKWCHYATVEGLHFFGTMTFGPPVVVTDSEEIAQAKHEEATVNCDKFIEIMQPFVGKTITVVYEATKVTTVDVPEDLGFVSTTSIVWPLHLEGSVTFVKDEVVLPRTDLEVHERLKSDYELLEGIQQLTAAVKELTNTISVKRGS
jgi:hypothetical protein